MAADTSKAAGSFTGPMTSRLELPRFLTTFHSSMFCCCFHPDCLFVWWQFPGLVVGTGLEDYFDSAFYFGGDTVLQRGVPFANALAGLPFFERGTTRSFLFRVSVAFSPPVFARFRSRSGDRRCDGTNLCVPRAYERSAGVHRWWEAGTYQLTQSFTNLIERVRLCHTQFIIHVCSFFFLIHVY